jgi:uncharacterized protein
MSAASPKTQEPSMEEILASIRRIIADDQQAKPAAAAPAPAPAPRPPEPTMDEDDVLDLAEVATPALKAPPLDVEEVAFGDIDFDAIEVEPDPPAPEPEPEPEPLAAFDEPEPEPLPPPPPPPQPERLVSNTTDASVHQAFNMLAHTVLTHNARTLEDLVGEMLRPMLKVWLDDNLPTMVERLVRAEIERVARGRP